MTTACSVEGCEKPRKPVGRYFDRYCSMHRARISRHGSPDVVLVVHGNLRGRCEAMIERPAGLDGCWLWTGARSEKGYAKVRVDAGRPWAGAHVVLYELLVGPVPEGFQLDHLCHTNDPTCYGGTACLHRRCVNPDHLEPVTHAENCRRGRRRH